MSEVSRSLNLIHEELAEVKAEMKKKTIRDENLESLVSSIVSKIIEQNNKELENKIKRRNKKAMYGLGKILQLKN